MNLLRQLYTYIISILKSRLLIYELAKQDFRGKYLGSYLGILWAFVQPTIQILIFWFVFQIGFKSKPIDDFPFILWLLCGMTPWFFIIESLSNATNAIVDNSYLVKKIVFRVSILPVVKIISALFIHLFFISSIFLIFLFYGYHPTLYNLQIFYYLTGTILLILGTSLITSSLVVFIKDLGQLIGMILQFGFWLTPIFWSLKIVPDKYHFLFKLNPVLYIVEGYRETFIYHKWFWEHPFLTIYFWFFTFSIFGIGALVFNRLRPHFSDVI